MAANVATVCVFATFAGDVALILAEWYCWNRNNINELRRGNKHTGVLCTGVSFFVLIFLIYK